MITITREAAKVAAQVDIIASSENVLASYALGLHEGHQCFTVIVGDGKVALKMNLKAFDLGSKAAEGAG